MLEKNKLNLLFKKFALFSFFNFPEDKQDKTEEQDNDGKNPSENPSKNTEQKDSDPKNSDPLNSGKLPTPKRSSNTMLLLVLLVVVGLIFVFYNNASSIGREEMTYSQFLQLLDADNVVSVTIVEEKEIRGQLRDSGILFSVKIPYYDSNLVTRLTNSNVVFKGADRPISLFQIFSTILPWGVSILFIFYLLRSLRGFGSGGMPFIKGKVRSYVRNNEKKVMFEDVAGQEEAKYELKEVVEFLKNPDKFQKLGARIPRGVLLVGNPGTGKTLLARACAGEANVNFFYMSGSDFVEMFAGVGAGRVRELFEQGRKNTPCLIFIDELDAVGRSRSSGYSGGVNDEREQTLNQLLVEMDGFEIRDRIIVLAATNRPDILDKALLRPGRFDRQVVVDMPDLLEREKILKIHARNIQVGESVDFSQVARATVGCSGADLANLVNEAALFAARHNRNQVEVEDLEEARDKILMGAARKSKVISSEEKLRTARHEAGHALLHLLLKNADPLHKVTIIPRGRALGVAFSLPENDVYGANKSYLIDRIALCYGGYIAEKMYYDETSSGVENDLQQATQIANKMVKDWGMSDLGPISYSDKHMNAVFPFDLNHNPNFSDSTINAIDLSIKNILQSGYSRAEKLLSENKDKLELLTSELIKYETLLGDQVHELLGIPQKKINVEEKKETAADASTKNSTQNNTANKTEETHTSKEPTVHEEPTVT